MKVLPVYKIRDFEKSPEKDAFYANYLKNHVKKYDFTHTPHKHDFFFLVLVTSGIGVHEIDFKKYEVKPGSLFILRPGQTHNWELSRDCDGYVFFHTRDFYDEGFTSGRILDYPFYSSHHSAPLITLKGRSFLQVKELLKQVTKEYMKDNFMKFQKLHALVDLIYIELSRIHRPATETGNETYLNKLKKFEALIEVHYLKYKTAGYYASLMNISEKHLNRISQTCLGKTSTRIISERIVLEAKRLLIQSRLNVTQTAYNLGYKDTSYFNRFFKKQAGQTPLDFVKRYKD